MANQLNYPIDFRQQIDQFFRVAFISADAANLFISTGAPITDFAILVDTNGATAGVGFDLILPESRLFKNKQFFIKKINGSSTRPVNIKVSGSDAIDSSSSTFALTYQWDWIHVIADGISTWEIMSTNVNPTLSGTLTVQGNLNVTGNATLSGTSLYGSLTGGNINGFYATFSGLNVVNNVETSAGDLISGRDIKVASGDIIIEGLGSLSMDDRTKIVPATSTAANNGLYVMGTTATGSDGRAILGVMQTYTNTADLTYLDLRVSPAGTVKQIIATKIGAATDMPLDISVGGAQTKLTLNTAGDIILGSATVATTATTGYPCIPTTGDKSTATTTYTPPATGMAPMVYDTSNNRLWIMAGGVWKYATFTS